jgi:hypothetical protein
MKYREIAKFLMAVTVKITVFWNMTPCSLVQVYKEEKTEQAKGKG